MLLYYDTVILNEMPVDQQRVYLQHIISSFVPVLWLLLCHVGRCVCKCLSQCHQYYFRENQELGLNI
jgi:hypothetical protein